jgi:CheY-like chemotaxis protein
LFAADPKIIQRLEPNIRRVLIIDPNPAAARLLAELVKGLGARELLFEPEERRALELAREADPQLVFVERTGPRLDGESFTRKLRRSSLSCRKAPVIMMTADATASNIKGARDCGVHEFLRKPFTAGDLLKRVCVVSLKARDWIEAVGYVGPDRRRFNSGEFSGEGKRKADQAQSRAEVQASATDQAVRILRSAITQFDSDPNQALRAMREQAIALKKLATMGGGEARLAVAVAALEIALNAAAPTRADLVAPVQGVLDLFQANAPQTAASAA